MAPAAAATTTRKTDGAAGAWTTAERVVMGYGPVAGDTGMDLRTALGWTSHPWWTDNPERTGRCPLTLDFEDYVGRPLPLALRSKLVGGEMSL